MALTMLAHGWNHIWGSGRIAGTARWFSSIGMRGPRFQAWLASITEIGSGALLMAGLATPFAAAAVIGTMTVALVANHLRNGFFIFRPGEGYEYVLVLLFVAFAIAALGPGTISLDSELGTIVRGWGGIAIGAGGVVTGAAVLIGFWRPHVVDHA